MNGFPRWVGPEVAPAGNPLIAGGSGFDPKQIPGLVALYDTSNAASLYQDDAFTTLAVGSGDPVGGLLDLSGAGRHLRQSSGTKRPAFKATDLNGGPCLQGDNLDDRLVTAAFAAVNQPVSVFACFQSPSNNGYLWDAAEASDTRIAFQVTSGQYAPSAGGTPFLTGVATDGLAHCVAIVYNGAASTFQIDGGSPLVATANLGTNAPGSFGVFSRRDGMGTNAAKLGFVAIVTGTMSAPTINQLRTYCRQRWGTP